MSNKDIPTIEVDIDPVAQNVSTFEKLGVSEASFNAFRQNVNGRVQANTDAIVTAETAVEELTDQIRDRYTKTETDLLLAEKVDLADSLRLKNLITNGDFSNGVTGWSRNHYTIEAVNNILTATVSALDTNARIGSPSINFALGDKWYVRFDILAKYKNYSFVSLGGYGAGLVNWQHGIIVNEWSTVSGIASVTADSTGQLYIYHSSNTDYAVGDTIQLRKILAINLTSVFGAGNEPTKEEMDKLIDLLGGWFDGEITVPQKTLAIWTLNLIRQNRNAIIALGGTII